MDFSNYLGQAGEEVKGFENAMRNLNKEIKAIQERTMFGLIDASILIRRDMDETPPLIPVDTGNLRASWFWDTFRNDKIFGLIMGFSSNYALWVHEMVGADFSSPRWRYKKGKKRYWYTPRQGAGAKFLEAAIKRNKDKILEIIRKNAQIK
jgi:hypothetical protein